MVNCTGRCCYCQEWIAHEYVRTDLYAAADGMMGSEEKGNEGKEREKGSIEPRPF